jgi:CRISPR/Cas system-associated exonuclease Cas4 (RecB family)
MISFLDQLTESIFPKVTSNSLIIVPTRRAAVQIERKLGQRMSTPGFLPTCIPIADLMDLCSGIPIANETRLLIDLFSAYKKIDPTIELDDFIKWGDQILADFDEVDRNLIDTQKLFKRIVDVKEIELMFSNDEYETELLNRFWNEFSLLPLSPLKESFISYWEKLPVLYDEFNSILSKNNYCYEGLAWRKTAQSIQRNVWFKQFDTIVFAGFYALTKSEEVIINYLVKNNNAIVYKDADTYYVDDKKQEAGNYLRKGMMAEAKNFIGDDLSKTAKNINIIQCNGGTAMAKDIGLELIQQFENLPATELSNAVVVLPDDTLLLPLLQVLDKKGILHNPSMGLALTTFPLLAFIKKIKSIRTQLLNTETNIESIVGSLFEIKSFNSLFLILHKSIEELKNSLLVPVKDYREEHAFLLNLINQFIEPSVHYQKQILSCIKNEIALFGTMLNNFDEEITIQSYWTLLINHINKIRIPIEANEGEGININGFLETRLTDYKYVFIANVNEGTLPSNSISKSLIPYAIRKFYSLPCKEEQEAVTAYHFYRLIQRCDQLSFFYNSQMTATGGGEKSRFILQIENELVKVNSNIKLNYIQYQSELQPLQAEDIVIEKTDEIIDKMIAKYVNIDNTQPVLGKGFSASSLSAYIYCPLKYYFEQIAKLRKPDELKGIDQMIFGRILHKAMEEIYKNQFKPTSSFYDNILLDHYIDEAIKKEYSDKQLLGNDYLLQSVIKELIDRIMLIDKETANLEIMSIEETFGFDFELDSSNNIFIKGIFDRLDLVNNQLRILDYKTGSGELTIPKDFSVIFSNSDYKIVFQLLLYVYIFTKQQKGEKRKEHLVGKEILAGAYLLKKNSKSITFLTKGKAIDEDLLELFEEHLHQLIGKIMSPEIPFTQTDDFKKCKYCDFKNICSR